MSIELFNQEAVQLDDLGQHPQIPTLLAYFTQDDIQYLLQEFIDGPNLDAELRQNGAYSEAQIWQLLRELLPVLQFCHARGVIHRDIKPENILRDRYGKLVLVDFGACKSATGTALNKTGTSIGTPEYVAPEQIRGRAIFASDIYSLGATCVHLLTARSPFDSYDINHDSWNWQQHLQTPLSSGLNSLLQKMLVSIPMHRYQTVDAVLQDLHQQSPPVTIVKPKSLPKPLSEIDLELEELKTQFLGGAKPQKPQPPKTSSPPAKNSVIDKELEELKAEYLRNQNP